MILRKTGQITQQQQLSTGAAGGGDSYGELYTEHAPAARRLALSMVPHDVADDIVAEAFARVLAAIRGGGGPDAAFRGYLLTAVRHLASDWLVARRRVTAIGDMSEETADLAAGRSADLRVQQRRGSTGRSPRRGAPDRPGLRPAAGEMAHRPVAPGGGGQGARRRGTRVRLVGQWRFGAGDAGPAKGSGRPTCKSTSGRTSRRRAALASRNSAPEPADGWARGAGRPCRSTFGTVPRVRTCSRSYLSSIASSGAFWPRSRWPAHRRPCALAGTPCSARG